LLMIVRKSKEGLYENVEHFMPDINITILIKHHPSCLFNFKSLSKN